MSRKNVTLQKHNRMKTEHIGYLTTDIDATAKAFEVFGYKKLSVIDFEDQKCSVCFLVKDGNVKVELVKPYENNKSLLRLLKKTGNSPYHVCYEVDNLDEMLVKTNTGGCLCRCFRQWQLLLLTVAESVISGVMKQAS